MALILLWWWTKQKLFCIWFDLYLYPSTQSSLPGTPLFDPWARGLLCRLDLSQFQRVCQIEAKNNCKVAKVFSFSFFQFLPQYDFGFPPRSSYVASCWEGSYPSSTNLVPQTNFKVLKNSQNLDLWGLKQLLRIHLLTKLLLLHLLCFGADFASLLHSIGLGSSPKRLHLIFSCFKWNNNTIHVTIHMVFLAINNAIFDI